MNLNTTLRRSYDTDLLILRTLFAVDPDTNLPISTNFVVTTDGIGGLVWMNPYTNLSTIGPGVGYLPSTLDSLQSNVSSLSTVVSSLVIGLSSLSTVLGQAYISSGVYTSQLVSTVEGLGTSQYLSTSQLTSTVQGLGSATYVSTQSLVSTTDWFIDPSRYVSTGALVSTTAGLFALPQLTSTVKGLGSIGYISSATLLSTVNAASTLLFSTFYSSLVPQFITPLQLTSTVSSLGTLGYISTAQLTSTVAGLTDPATYVSTGALVSTVVGISTNIRATYYIDNGGNFNILGGTAIVSSATSIVFLSTFVLSSLTYQGTNGTVTPVVYPNPTTGRNLFFSSATIPLALFSNYILPNSRVNLELYPTMVFPSLNTGATSYLLTPMSTMLAYGNSYVSPFATNWVFANNKTAGYGNLYQQSIHLQIPGSALVGNFANPYRIVHSLPESVTSNLTPGFTTSNLELQFGSTNSVFLSIQNLP